MNASGSRSSRSAKEAAAAADRVGRYQWSAHGSIRKSIRATSSTAKRAVPGRSMLRRPPGDPDSRSAPRTGQAAESGTSTVRTARRPPSAGPTTATVWLATAGTAGTPAGYAAGVP
ncbi:hypothetical protein [Streptomyces cellostaticus]|nr:hypothetical protein [Streptomyces cellostaticus]GHI03726.1 hypothetical protein Scel_20470 [Streptomyces cellostaticus]